MPNINGTPSVSDVMSIPTSFGGLNNGLAGIAQYIGSQYQNIQGLQLQQAQDLNKFKTLDQVYYGGTHGPQLDQLLSQNPYGRALISRNQGQGMAGAIQVQGGPSTGMPGGIASGATMIGAPGVNPMTGASVYPSIAPQGSPTGGGGSSSSVDSSGPVVTGGSVTQKAFEPPSFSKSYSNPSAEKQVAQAKAEGEGVVKPGTEYATKMSGSQALAQENLVRDDTQMNSVFRTLQNQLQLHNQLVASKLAGTDLGYLALKNLGHVGTAAALFGGNPTDVQNALVKPEDQQNLGQFVAGRNEGITRAIQPMQNQVDKTGSSRISDSLLDLTEGEYGKLEDTPSEFLGKTKGTAQTLYRITLASQQYADELAKKGIQLNSKDPNFNPDKVAQNIYSKANSIEFTPAQEKQFNTYWQQISGGGNKGFTPKGMPGQSLPQNQAQAKPQQGNAQYSPDVISKYNQLRSSGVSMQDAKKQLGL